MRTHRLARATAFLALLLSALAALPVSTAAETVAVIVEVSGEVRVERPGSAPRAAAVGDQLQEGDVVTPTSGARAVILFRTGRVERATAAVTVSAGQGERAGMFARATETLTQIASTDARSQPNRQGMIRPIAGAAVPVSPRNGIPVLSTRPTLVWMSLPGTTSYSVQIGHVGSTPIRIDAGPDTVWALPASMVLEPGASYVWTVGPTGDGRVAPPQRFRSASHEERAALRERMRELRAAGLDPDREGLFLAALIYRDAGFLYEADEALERLDAAGGHTGRAFHTLRGEIYDALGRLDEAAREFTLADAAAR